MKVPENHSYVCVCLCVCQLCYIRLEHVIKCNSIWHANNTLPLPHFWSQGRHNPCLRLHHLPVFNHHIHHIPMSDIKHSWHRQFWMMGGDSYRWQTKEAQWCKTSQKNVSLWLMEVLQWKKWTDRSNRSGQVRSGNLVSDLNTDGGKFTVSSCYPNNRSTTELTEMCSRCLDKHSLDVAFQTFHRPVVCFIQILLFRWGLLAGCFCVPLFSLLVLIYSSIQIVLRSQ